MCLLGLRVAGVSLQREAEGVGAVGVHTGDTGAPRIRHLIASSQYTEDRLSIIQYTIEGRQYMMAMG